MKSGLETDLCLFVMHGIVITLFGFVPSAQSWDDLSLGKSSAAPLSIPNLHHKTKPLGLSHEPSSLKVVYKGACTR
jgi:hypothetical protein